MGICANGQNQCKEPHFLHGPMAVVVSQIVESRHGYAPLINGCCGYASKSALTDRVSDLKAAKKSLGLPGRKRGKETRYFFNNARALARIAHDIESELNDKVVAVLFRDSDGTASAGRGLWEEKVQSMLDGFAEERFDRGVPMVPKPKSEAWVICALKQDYIGCDALESRSGNDDSPKSLKRELEKHLGNLPDRVTLCDLVAKREVCIDQLQMSSFRAFRSRLEQVM